MFFHECGPSFHARATFFQGSTPAYRNDDAMARKFASDYRRKHRVAPKPAAAPANPPATPEG